MKKVVSIMVIAILVISLFTGCAKNEEVSNLEETRTDLIVGISGEGSSVDPHKGGGGNREVIDNIIMGLTRLDAEANVIPGIASEWTISDDGMEYVFTIDSEIKFANGDVVTVDDIKYSLERGRADLNNAARYEAVNTIEIEDDQHIKITLNYPCAMLLPNLSCSSMAILNKEVVEAAGEDFGLNSKGACAGPYDFDSWESGVCIKLVENPYYEKDLDINNVEFRFIGEASTGVISVESGDIDAFMNPNYIDVENINNDKITVYSQLKNGFDFLGFNLNKAPFDNVLVRQAVAHSYDPQELVEAAIGKGGADVANSFLPEFVFGADDSPSPYSYNPEKAKALLKEAGYPDGMEINVVTMSNSYMKAAEYLQEVMKESGFTVNIQLVEMSRFVQDLINGNLEAFIIGVTEDYPDADLTLYAQFKSDGGQNVHSYNNAEVDRLLKDARQCTDEQQRENMYIQTQKILMNDLPAIPLYFSKSFALYNSNLQNFRTNYSSNVIVEDISW